MKKYLVIGNPIEHSLSPELHNFWIKKNNINATYEKKRLDIDQLEKLILDIRKEKIMELILQFLSKDRYYHILTN